MTAKEIGALIVAAGGLLTGYSQHTSKQAEMRIAQYTVEQLSALQSTCMAELAEHR